MTKTQRKIHIANLLKDAIWHVHYSDTKTGRRVLSHSPSLQHRHEEQTAVLLSKMNYDVIFVPNAMFKRSDKRFDVLLLRDTIILKDDLKSLTTKNPDTIGNRIKEGSDQASRVVMDIRSDIGVKALIHGLRTGTYKNKLLKEIFLFYRSKFYVLPKNLIESKRIYELLK